MFSFAAELLNINALPLDLNASSLDTRSSHLVTKIWDKLQAPVTKKLQHDAEDYALTRYQTCHVYDLQSQQDAS